MNENTIKKLKILADAAKYDVSCSSSGVSRGSGTGSWGGVGSAQGMGLCHSFTDDGRCISLLKILFTNYCKYDCAYCINRQSNDVPRAAFSSAELAELVIEFYRRNYIEGLFLSSGVVQNPDYTMERMLRALSILRHHYGFNGYIHLKSIPGTSPELVHEAGLLADRMSINIEIPSEQNLKMLAPDKDHQSVYKPMYFISQGILENQTERKKHKKLPKFTPAGQSTQMIIGASNERDKDILKLSSLLYSGPQLKRVYYSGFIPVNSYDSRLPALREVPLVRENRLYQADWLMRFYQFEHNEIANDDFPDLDMELDPKISWALRNPEFFPIDPNRADYPVLLRVPGIGLTSAKRIIVARRHGKLDEQQLNKLGVVMKRAKFFLKLTKKGFQGIDSAGADYVRAKLITGKQGVITPQLSLFGPTLPTAAKTSAPSTSLPAPSLPV